jgi:hypothetical protein
MSRSLGDGGEIIPIARAVLLSEEGVHWAGSGSGVATRIGAQADGSLSCER